MCDATVLELPLNKWKLESELVEAVEFVSKATKEQCAQTNATLSLAVLLVTVLAVQVPIQRSVLAMAGHFGWGAANFIQTVYAAALYLQTPVVRNFLATFEHTGLHLWTV